VAYEVIKRVGGRAYRYRVESYRDPETRRVRGKWTYLGRVEGEGTLSPERQARPSSRGRLLDALERLLETHEVAALSTGLVAQEAGLAYGTFYRYFKDLDHIVREAMLRHANSMEQLGNGFSGELASAQHERVKIVAWIADTVTSARSRPGVTRAWFVASNQDPVIVVERQRRFDATVEQFTAYITRLNEAGLAAVAAPRFNAYALVALASAVVRECAVERTFTDEKLAGIADVLIDMCGLTLPVALPEAAAV
jgi:AcrR family transcriptional regulator